MRIAIDDVDLELVDDKMGPTFVRINQASIHQGVDRDTFMQTKASIDKSSNKLDEKYHLHELRMKNQELRQRLKEACELLRAKNIPILDSDLDL
uniref:Uncharacterized protein n=1 Tax=Romanomermis culicivorax TaxID=13658 RepID=A0A915JPV6_ROMCU